MAERQYAEVSPLRMAELTLIEHACDMVDALDHHQRLHDGPALGAEYRSLKRQSSNRLNKCRQELSDAVIELRGLREAENPLDRSQA